MNNSPVPYNDGSASNSRVVAETDPDFSTARRAGLILFFLVFGVFGVWAAAAPLDGAVHAPGTVVVRSYKQVVQHLEGGIVQAIHVRDGDRVQAGDMLMSLDSTQALSNLAVINAAYISFRAQEARLVAERDGLEAVVFPPDLVSMEAASLNEMASQLQLFRTRKLSLEGAIDVLEQRITQLESRLVGMRAQRQSKLELAASYQEELADVQALLAEGFSDRNRLRELERNIATLEGDAAELLSSISSTEIQMGETRLEIIQQTRQFQNDVATELAEVQTRLADTRERITGLRDVVERTSVRAPVNGVVNGLQIHTIGGVISPGQMIAEVVPQTEELIVEASVSPTDIDRVSTGQDATIRFSTFGNQVPSVFGRVILVSADAFTDQHTGQSYYTARVEVTPEGMAELDGLVLMPGMPAEAFISTGSRTFLQYLMKPISNALARSFIED